MFVLVVVFSFGFGRTFFIVVDILSFCAFLVEVDVVSFWILDWRWMDGKSYFLWREKKAAYI